MILTQELKNIFKEKIDNTKNKITDKDIDKLKLTDKLFFKCNKCQQSVLRNVKSFIKNPNACSICAGKTIIIGYNDFASKFPNLLHKWDYKKNDLNPEEYTYKSGKKVWIICHKCNQSTLRTIASFANKPDSCSICSGKIVIQGINDFATLHPELLDEWDYKKNTKLPTEISKTSQYEVWWICKICGHSFHSPTYNKIYNKGGKNGCDVCHGHTFSPGINDAATKYPEITTEWNFIKNNLKPNEVFYKSLDKFWLICGECQTEYERAMKTYWDKENNRKRLCPKCLRSKNSYGEDELYNFCVEIDNETINNYRFLKNSLKEIDLYLPNYKIGIEFNGDYWHSDKVMIPKYKMTAEEYHRQKFELAKENGITLLYVWASDYYTDEERMKSLLKENILNNTIDSIFKKFKN